MQNFIKTLISAVQTWTKKEIKKTEDRIVDSTADWNENDSSKDSYIKNRTHWEEVKQKYLIPETSVFISEDYGDESLSDSLPLLTIGQEYIVVLNGTTYKCIAREYDGSSAIIGNGTIYGDDNEGNGEPFSCDSYDDGSIYLNVATAGKYTISISIAQTEIHKIDRKYIDMPDNIATTKYVDNSLETKLDNVNPAGKGSFSINRTSSSIGKYSSTLGNELIAKHLSENALGQFNKNDNVNYIIVEGTERSEKWKNSAYVTVSTSYNFNSETGVFELVDGISTRVTNIQPGQYYLASNIAIWLVLSNESYDMFSRKLTFIVFTRESATSAKGKYLQTIGNGESDSNRSNAYTLDWNGVGWFQGGLQVGGNAQNDGAKNVLLEGDAIPIPETAQPGQILSVKSVDENSKPTEWEAVNAIKTVNNIKPDEDGNVELDAGFSPSAIVEQTESGAVISITDKDGTTTATITNGQRGTGILHVTTKPSVWDDGEAPYRMMLKTIMSQAGVNEVLVGDIVQHGCDQYKVLGMNEQVTFAYLDNPVSIKGVDGTNGKSAYEYAQEAGYTGTKTQFAKKLASDNGVSSWNALSDKPFYEMDTLFDGNTSGHEVVMFNESMSFVKMNDHVFTEEECIGKVASVYIEANDTVAKLSVSANGIVDLADLASGFSGFLVLPDELMTYEIPAVMIIKEPVSTDYISLSAGTYYAVVDNDSIGKGHTTYFSAFDDVVTLKKLDEKYLPDSVVQVEAVKKAVNPYFEGNIEGYTFLTFDGSNEEDGIGGLVKITDYILTEEECLGATVTASFEGVTFNDAITKKGDFTDVVGLPCDAYYADGSSTPYVVIIKSSGIGSGNIEGVEVSAGTYYIYMDTSGMDGGKTFITHFSALDNKEVVEEKINPKYLPNEVALKSDIPSIEGLASEEYVNDLINAALSAIPNTAEVAY